MEQSQELSKALEELTRAISIALDIHTWKLRKKIDPSQSGRFVLFVYNLIKRSITRIIFC